MSNHMGWGIGLIGNWKPEGFWFQSQSQLQIKKLESGLVEGEVMGHVQSTAKAQKS